VDVFATESDNIDELFRISIIQGNQFCDFTFIVQGKQLYAHRVILSSRCEYFKLLFDSQMKEATEGIIHVPDISYECFVVFLLFLYTDRTELTGDNVVDLLALANQYNVPRLTQLCEQHIVSNMDNTNVCNLYQIADLYQADQLKLYCKSFIKKEYNTVRQTDDFTNLPVVLQQEIFSAIKYTE